jgi:hypothetical protein
MHFMALHGLQKQLYEGKTEGKRSHGRPRRTWHSDIREWTGLGTEDLLQITK